MMGRTNTYQENPLRVNHSSHVSCMYWETPLKVNSQPAHEQKVKKKQSQTEFAANSYKTFLNKTYNF